MVLALVNLHNMCIGDLSEFENRQRLDEDSVSVCVSNDRVFASYEQAPPNPGRRRDLERSRRRELFREKLLEKGMKRAMHSNFSCM